MDPLDEELNKPKGQTHDPYGPNYIGPSNTGQAKSGLLSEVVMLGGVYAAVRNPLKAIEILGIDPSDPQELSLELATQKARLNPGNLTFGKVKRLKKGVERIVDTVGSIVSGPKPAFATVNVDDGLFRSVVNQVTDTKFEPNTVFASISQKTRQTQAYIDWTRRGQEWLDKAKREGKKNPMTGYENFKDPETGITYRKGYTTSKDTMGNIDLDGRKIRDAKRLKTTRIPEEEVEKIMKKYNQPPEMVKMFMDYQKAGKKNIDSTIERINKRIIEARKKDPNAFPGVKASLGHGRAASRYEHSGDIVSNIDLENFFINVQRSNLDEVSDPFNRALGRSLDLDEEILKFIDKDISKFHKGFTPTGGPLTRKQKDIVIDYVKKRIDKNIDWKSHTAPTGEQLFKSKEEYLINEALEFVTTKKKSN